VLRHAAESEAILANPLSLVRPPRAGHAEAVGPLAPLTVEAIRAAMVDQAPREVGRSRPGQRGRRSYTLPAVGTPHTRSRDALIVSLLAYSGIRPGELRALRWADVRDRTLLVQRGADQAGKAKATKTRRRRPVRLLPLLTQDLREHRLLARRPPDRESILLDEDGEGWSKTTWQLWRRDRWAPACRAAGLGSVPRPYDLRHSFASLLLAEGRQPLYVAAQLGHSVAVLYSTYAHLIAEYAEAPPIDAEDEIRHARAQVCVRTVSDTAG
jgi:integrase